MKNVKNCNLRSETESALKIYIKHSDEKYLFLLDLVDFKTEDCISNNIYKEIWIAEKITDIDYIYLFWIKGLKVHKYEEVKKRYADPIIVDWIKGYEIPHF